MSPLKLHKWGGLNSLAKLLAKPLSLIACSRFLCKPVSVMDAYLNFLLGKGAGTGWDLTSEINTALSLTHRPTPVILDIGANVGSWSEHFRRLSSTAKLFMLEPSPGCRAEIATKSSLNNAIVIPAAASAHAGKASLYFSDPTDGTASLHRRGDTFFHDLTYSQMEVETVTIDDIIKSWKLDFIDFLKMDIEGNELFALHGASDALSKRLIGAMLFEFGSGNINSRTFFRQFWDLLDSAGFRIWRIAPGGQLVPINEYYEDLEYFRGVSNYVAQLKDHPFAPAPSGR